MRAIALFSWSWERAWLLITESYKLACGRFVFFFFSLNLLCPWVVHKLSMSCPWVLHELSLICPWVVLESSLCCPWVVFKLSQLSGSCLLVILQFSILYWRCPGIVLAVSLNCYRVVLKLSKSCSTCPTCPKVVLVWSYKNRSCQGVVLELF